MVCALDLFLRCVLRGINNDGGEAAIVVNLVTGPYNWQEPDEFRVSPYSADVPYEWACKEG